MDAPFLSTTPTFIFYTSYNILTLSWTNIQTETQTEEELFTSNHFSCVVNVPSHRCVPCQFSHTLVVACLPMTVCIFMHVNK